MLDASVYHYRGIFCFMKKFILLFLLGLNIGCLSFNNVTGNEDTAMMYTHKQAQSAVSQGACKVLIGSVSDNAKNTSRILAYNRNSKSTPEKAYEIIGEYIESDGGNAFANIEETKFASSYTIRFTTMRCTHIKETYCFLDCEVK